MTDETRQKQTRPDPDYSGLVPYTPRRGPNAIMVDLDGTLCRRVPAAEGGRSPYDETRVGEDVVCEAVMFEIVLHADVGDRIIFMSGRSEACRPATEAWLREHLPEGLVPEGLFMRPARDGRPDWVVKAQLFDEHVRDNYRVRLVLDDRDQVVGMWRAIGLPCFQVAPGDF